jgi:glycosyltransferase involved in cell wall biosynthesis
MDEPDQSKQQPMRIAVFLERGPNTGGGFHQAMSMVEGLARSAATTHEILVFAQYEATQLLLTQHGIDAIRYKRSILRLIDRWSATEFGGALLRRAHRLGFTRLGRHLDTLLDEYGIDLVVLTELGEAALRLSSHPFIVTVWDVFYRDRPELSEPFIHGNWHQYDAMYRAILPRAYAVIADSPHLARRLTALYQVNPERIIKLPFLPPIAVRQHAAGGGEITAEETCRKYNLQSGYIFYPAYFSAHKNHLYLLEGLIELERRHGIIRDAVFCGGGEPGDQPIVERQVQALGLTSRVHFLGLVPDEDVPALYEAALALVMPAYSGPTNLPPLAAVTLGCPVIYSDLPEFREQMGDAALYCDLNHPSNLADHLASLLGDPMLLDRLRTAGRRLAAEIAEIDYAQILRPVFDDYAYLSRRWSSPDARR